jgi:ribonuclease HI
MADEREVAELLLANELALLDPAVRRDRRRLMALLDDDFEEFGASGRVWTHDEIVDGLATGQFEPPEIEDFRCRVLAPGVALVTYRTVRTTTLTAARSAANRSSIWTEVEGGWRIRFHQGTPAA